MNIVNKHTHKSSISDYYIGRPSDLGNPFSVEEFGRDSAIEKYKDYLCEKINQKDDKILSVLNLIYRNRSKINLVCFCSPMKCHGEFIKNLIEFKARFKKGVFSGIVSRQTPPEFLEKITKACYRLGLLGYTLRSGGAVGADSRAYEGCLKAKGKAEIFKADSANEASLRLAEKFHPNWKACSDYAKKLHARNGFIVMGQELNDPVDFVLCWTHNGELQGGTAQGLRIAEAYKIPVFNLAITEFPLL